ncbi:clock-controlled protein-like protein 8 [Xylogone sp. PMI_703]|nr:clock-controlled protein-like protein 8 [Xylogone sp. PMI_703]
MEQQQDHMHRDPPSYEQSYGSHTTNLPPVPTANLPPPLYPERTLPPLPASPPTHPSTEYSWPSSNPLTAYYQPGPSKLSPLTKPLGVDSPPNTMDVDTPDGRGRRAGSVLSIDDPDVRMAAEALGDLRADFVHSPTQKHRSSPSSARHYESGSSSAREPEPLLSLLTTSHPLIGTAIGGSLSVYSASKNFSPRFKTGAEYVEKQFTPVLNTVGSVGRLTGVEGGVRWFLGGRRPSHHPPTDLENGDSSNKRRRVEGRDGDQDKDRDRNHVHHQELQHRDRRSSQSSTVESLPAYDENRSPSYEASQQALVATQSDQVANQGSTWPSRLIMSTSGLSIAMSEESLRSLKYCLSWLRWANEHIGKIIVTLKSVLERYDSSASRGEITNGDQVESPRGQLVVREEDRSELNARVAELKADVLKTLKEAIDIVSKYAGGALPENARTLVRRHLTSLPQRFRIASMVSGAGSSNGQQDATESANRVMILAKEGLDMMSQVSGVLDGTIVSAEEWCERLGRKKREEREAEREKPPMSPPAAHGNGNVQPNSDVKMG